MTRVLVCGGTGFIGRNILESLLKTSKNEVHATYFQGKPFESIIDNRQIKWHYVDLRREQCVSSLLGDIRPEIIIQAAATTSGSKDIITKPYIHVTDNAVINSILLREAMANKVKHFIFFSCTVMYQNSKNAIKETDWDPSNPIHDRYFGVGNTKAYIEQMLDFYSRISEMKCTAIRHSNVYGPHDKFDLERSHVFGATISKVMTAEDKVSIWGSGEEERDLLYIDDLVTFVDAVIKNQVEKYSLYNCGYGRPCSVRNLVEQIIATSRKNLTIDHDLSKPTIKTSIYLDCTKSKEEIGWTPKVTLNEGISKTIKWWQDRVDPATLTHI